MAVAPIAMLAVGLAGAAVSAYGAYQQGQSQKAQMNYEAQVQQQNALVAQQNQRWAAAQGASEAQQQSLESAQRQGQIRAAMGANDVDVNSGSALGVTLSQKMFGQLSSMNVESQAARTGYAYGVQKMGYQAQGALDTFQGQQAAKAGTIGAVGSLLSGASSVGSKYAGYNLYGS